MSQPIYDIVVVGAGPAGLAAAITLSLHRGLTVLVVDSGRADKVRAGESIPPAALSSLRFLGVMDEFREAAHFAYPGNASLWGRDIPGYNDALMDPLGPPWRIDRPVFDKMLAGAATRSGVEISWETQLLAQQSIADGYELRLFSRATRQESLIRARFVIDASGPGAQFAHALGVKTLVEDQLLAVVRFSDTQPGVPLTSQTLIEADAQGWWYAAKLPGQRLVTMYVTEAATMRQFNKDLSAHFAAGIGYTSLVAQHLQPVGAANESFYKFPVYSSILEQVYGERWLAAGDAACSFDPIAAQGIYKSLSTGIRAAKAAISVLTGDAPAGALDAYREYIQHTYHTYAAQRHTLYSQEQRWPHAPFWSQRHSIPQPAELI